MSKINFKIVTPERVVYEAEIDQVTLPTQLGEITVLPGHIPLVTALAFGELLAKKKNEDIPFAIWGGFAEIADNRVIILAAAAEYAPEIEVDKIEQAKNNAADLMKKKGEFSIEEYEELLLGYQKQIAQLKVAQKYQTKKYRELYNIREVNLSKNGGQNSQADINKK